MIRDSCSKVKLGYQKSIIWINDQNQSLIFDFKWTQRQLQAANRKTVLQ